MRKVEFLEGRGIVRFFLVCLAVGKHEDDEVVVRSLARVASHCGVEHGINTHHDQKALEQQGHLWAVAIIIRDLLPFRGKYFFARTADYVAPGHAANSD